MATKKKNGSGWRFVTVELPEELIKRIKDRAEVGGMKLKGMYVKLLESGLAESRGE